MANLLSQQPQTTVDRFGRIFDDLFDNNAFWHGFLPANLPGGWYPAVDVKTTDKEYIFTAEVPGVNKEDIDVEMIGDMLTIKGKRMEEKEEKGENYIRKERRSGSFQRSFRLDPGIEPNQIKADYQQGVLTVRAPRKTTEQPKRISVH